MSTGGRNNTGRITVALARRRSQAGLSHHRLQAHASSTCRRRVERIEYDPNRTAFIALIRYDGRRADLHPRAAASGAVGDKIIAGDARRREAGQRDAARATMPVGTIVHNVEMKPGKGGQIARSAGTYAQYGRPRPGLWRSCGSNSGEQRMVQGQTAWPRWAPCPTPTTATSNIGKAGRKRWLGKQAGATAASPMNPVDHPHGGGEGRTSGGRHPVTPWGKPTKGKKTRTNKRDRQVHRSHPPPAEEVRRSIVK